jgi:hypothetical protein
MHKWQILKCYRNLEHKFAYTSRHYMFTHNVFGEKYIYVVCIKRQKWFLNSTFCQKLCVNIECLGNHANIFSLIFNVLKYIFKQGSRIGFLILKSLLFSLPSDPYVFTTYLLFFLEVDEVIYPLGSNWWKIMRGDIWINFD